MAVRPTRIAHGTLDVSSTTRVKVQIAHDVGRTPHRSPSSLPLRAAGLHSRRPWPRERSEIAQAAARAGTDRSHRRVQSVGLSPVIDGLVSTVVHECRFDPNASCSAATGRTVGRTQQPFEHHRHQKGLISWVIHTVNDCAINVLPGRHKHALATLMQMAPWRSSRSLTASTIQHDSPAINPFRSSLN